VGAGAWSRTPITLLEAVRGLKEPLIEMCLSNIYRRETLRPPVYAFPAARGIICGFGPRGCLMAFGAPMAMLDDAH
jgi:3-dehydroquinate dehydratase-2